MSQIDIPSDGLNEWLAVLKPYQRNTIQVFLKEQSPGEAAERWLGATGSPNIISFGGTRDTKPFWESFRAEFRKFCCDDSAYTEEKKAIQAMSPVNKAILVSAVSAAIGATIGYTATLLAPAVTILLFTVGTMGVNAYCNKG